MLVPLSWQSRIQIEKNDDEDVVELKISLINDEDEDGGNAAWGRKREGDWTGMIIMIQWSICVNICIWLSLICASFVMIKYNEKASLRRSKQGTHTCESIFIVYQCLASEINHVYQWYLHGGDEEFKMLSFDATKSNRKYYNEGCKD